MMADWKEKLRKLTRARAPAPSGVPADRTSNSKSAIPTTTSPDRQSGKTQRRYVCIGLDFGTSSTKVVIRLQQAEAAYAVPFEAVASKDQPYLAPTRLWVDESGQLLLIAKGKGRWVQELKVRLMEDPLSVHSSAAEDKNVARPVDYAAGYVALILRCVFSWFEMQLRPQLGDAEIVWSFNLGIPARDYGASQIKEAFHTVACAGWQIARGANPIDIRRAHTAVETARIPRFAPQGIDPAAINVVPEVAAGVTSYVRSKQRVLGPHLFIDVGATTLDTSLFLLVEGEEGFKYTFLAADVDSHLGALRLHRHRADSLGHLAFAKFEASDPLKPIPQAAADCMPSRAEAADVDVPFSEKCVVNIDAVVAKAKKKAPVDLSVSSERDGRGKAADESPLRVLLSGGGVQLELYQQAIREAAMRAEPNGKMGLRIKPFRLVPIEKPAAFNAPHAGQHGWMRLAIAYGLSFPIDDLGEFVPESEVSELKIKPREKADDDFVSKDQV